MDVQAQSDLGPLLSSQVGKRIFVDLAQQPLKIFVEPGEVTNRPKLVRILKNGGGLICEDVTEADIVVVEPETVSATQLIESWIEEKVFLNTNWVYRSIERGGAYLEDEDWGGFAVVKGNAVTIRNHLPTPRETPSEQQVPQEKSFIRSQPHSLPNASQFVQAGSPMSQVSQFQLQQMSQQLPDGQPFNAISGMMHPNANVVVPAQLLAQLMGVVQQHGMSTAAMSMPQVGQIPNQMPLNAVPGQPFVPGLPQQAVAPFMSPPGIFVQGSFPLQQQSSTFPQQVVSMPFPQQPMDVGSPVHTGHYHGSVSPEEHSQMHRHSNMSESRCSSPMDLDEPATLKRKARSADPMTGSSRKKRAKARENGAHHKRHRRNESDDESLPPSADASPVSSSQRSGSPEDEQLFEKRPGVPFRFFVQLGMNKRHLIASAIKKHGGKMECNIADADFVILGSPTTKNFEEWLRQSGYFGKIPVKSQWVSKCVDMNYIVELDEYVYEGCKVKKRGRQSSTGSILAPVQSGSEEEEAGDENEETDTPAQDKVHKQTAVKKMKENNVNAEKKLRNGLERKSGKKASYKAISNEGGGRSRVASGKTNGKIKAKTTQECSPPQTAHWAPSPPPPTRVVEHVPGKNRYTEDDISYCDKYIPILLERDPTTTISSIADKLHAKMPHHPKGSWMSHLSHPSRRGKLEGMRRRAEISNRKAQSSISMVNEGPVTEPSAPPVAAIDPFQVLTTFFAEGRADNLADSAVWHVMAGEYPQMSAVAWEAFWMEHHETIAMEVSRLTGLDTQQGAGVLARYSDGQNAKAEPD